MKNSIQIPSSLQHIHVIEDYIEHIRTSLKIKDCIYGNIHLAVVEAVTNAIVHGNQSDENKEVVFKSVRDEKTIKFIIQDEGCGFDLGSVPDPTLPENKKQLNGRGVFLIRYLADEVTFENNGSCIHMTFFLS